MRSFGVYSSDTIYLRGRHQQTTNATLSLSYKFGQKSHSNNSDGPDNAWNWNFGYPEWSEEKPSFRNPNLHHDVSLPNSNCLKSGHILTKVSSTQLTSINMQTQMTSFSDSLFLTLQKSVFQFHFLIHRFLLNS